MALKFCSFSSGSSGNCYFIQTETTAILVDAGISAKKIKEGLAQIGTEAGTLRGLLLTHEHSDHIKSASTLLKQLPQMELFANSETLEAANLEIPGEEKVQLVKSNRAFKIGDIMVTALPVSHDAANPVGYSFSSGSHQITIITDTGYIPGELFTEMGNADLLVLEANYDSDMLKIGRYPWFLKQRIAGDRGHLSNEAAGEALRQILAEHPKRRQVFLGHLSKENNFPDMAYQTVKNILEEKKYYIGKHLELQTLLRDKISGSFRV